MARQSTMRGKKGATDEALAEASAAPGPARDSAELNRRIERRAYEIWEREGRPAGCEEEHWRRAEAELAAEAVGPASAGGEQAVGGPEATSRAAAKRPRAAAKRGAEPGEAAATPATRRRRQTG